MRTRGSIRPSFVIRMAKLAPPSTGSGSPRPKPKTPALNSKRQKLRTLSKKKLPPPSPRGEVGRRRGERLTRKTPEAASFVFSCLALRAVGREAVGRHCMDCSSFVLSGGHTLRGILFTTGG